MSAPNSTSPHESPAAKQLGPAHPLAICFLAASLAGMTTFLFARQQFETLPGKNLAIPESPSISMPSADASVPRRDVLRATFFDEQVEPQIDATDRLNREAAERCVQKLGRIIDNYRRHVPPFVEDLTSLSTRLGIVRRMPGGWWNEDRRVESYIEEKFESHLFSQQSLMRDVAGALEQFRVDVDANQKRMLASVRASLNTADLPEVKVEEYEQFFASVAQQLNDYSTKQGSSSVYNAITVLVMSEAGSYAAITIVSGLIARLGAMASTTVAAGGVTAGASAAGAGGGSLAGPVGTAVGLGVGLVIGLTIDWWMTERFEDELTIQMMGYMNALEEAILHGTPTSASTIKTESPQGIAEALPLVCDQLKLAYRERFYEQIVMVEPSS